MSSPLIFFSGPPSFDVYMSTFSFIFQDPGANATDDVDMDLTSQIVTTTSSGMSLDTSVPGILLVMYDVVDSSGNAADTVTREVTVVADIDPPTITVEDNIIVVRQGESFTDSFQARYCCMLLHDGRKQNANFVLCLLSLFSMQITAEDIVIDGLCSESDVELCPMTSIDLTDNITISGNQEIIENLETNTFLVPPGNYTFFVDVSIPLFSFLNTCQVNYTGRVLNQCWANVNYVLQVLDLAGNSAPQQVIVVSVIEFECDIAV